MQWRTRNLLCSVHATTTALNTTQVCEYSLSLLLIIIFLLLLLLLFVFVFMIVSILTVSLLTTFYLHTGYYDPTSTLLIRVETVEGEKEQLCVVGYAVLNIFVEAKDVSKQPTESTLQVAPVLIIVLTHYCVVTVVVTLCSH